jgi:hypothetical protein
MENLGFSRVERVPSMPYDRYRKWNYLESADSVNNEINLGGR